MDGGNGELPDGGLMIDASVQPGGVVIGGVGA